jgi:hypothetical protein
MKVIYPGPSVQGSARTEPTLHPRAGRLEVGQNTVPDGLARELLAAGLVEPEPARLNAEPAAPARRRSTRTTAEKE